MPNYTVKVNNDKLTIEIDISPKALKAAEPSKSGKTLVVASTSGFEKIEGSDLKMNLNVTLPNPKRNGV